MKATHALTKNSNRVEFEPLTKTEDILRYGERIRITHYRTGEWGKAQIKTDLATPTRARNYWRALTADGYNN